MSDFLTLQGAKDLNTDAIHIGAVANSVDPATGAPIDAHVNRVGGTDYTLQGFWDALGPVVMPWTSATGGTLTQPNQAFLHPANGNYYSWTGAFPKVVAPGTDPTAVAGYVPRTDVVLRSDISNGEFNEKLGSRYPSVSSAISDTTLSVGDRVIVDNYHLNGNSGVLFFNVVAAGTGVVDGGKYINTNNGLQLKQNIRLPMSPSAWGAKGDGTDDSVAINKMISHFKSTLPIPPANKNYDAGGKGLDFSGYTNSLAATVDFTGIDNLSIYNPSFVALPGFVGTELAKFSSLDPTWYAENITLWNPYFDCNWNVDLGFDAADFLNLKVMGGKITHYRKKGFRTRQINVGPHEVNMTGTFIFQKEFDETYPVDITEGEAFEIGNYDNNFTGIIAGPQMTNACTMNSGANMFSNCHFYCGATKAVRSLDTADDFDLCYFDTTPLKLRNRSSVSDSYFVLGETMDFGIELTSNDPFQVRITQNRFRKQAGPSTPAIKMKTMAAGRIIRPTIRDNQFDGCQGVETAGKWFIAVTASSTTFTVPDQYLPLSSFGPVSLAATADGAFADRLFGCSYTAATNQMQVKCYQVSGGGLLDSNLGGKSAVINLNL